QAADVAPIVVPVTPAAPAVAAGPTINVDITAGTAIGLYGPGNWYVDISAGGDIDVQSISGWGFRFSGGGGATIVGGGGYGYGFTGEIYKAIGNLEIGFAVTPYNFAPLDIEFGP